MPENKSEVARLLKQISMEYESSWWGLKGLACGTARHDFITVKMERVAVCHTTLQGLVGEQEADKLVAEVLERADTEENV